MLVNKSLHIKMWRFILYNKNLKKIIILLLLPVFIYIVYKMGQVYYFDVDNKINDSTSVESAKSYIRERT